MVRTPPPGTPAAPTLDAVAVTLGDGTQSMEWAQRNVEHGSSHGLETENHTTLGSASEPRRDNLPSSSNEFALSSFHK